MTVSGIIGAIIIGLILGVLGRLIAPGKQDIPIWLTIVVGIVAALIGSAIVGSLRDTNGIDWVELLVQLILATVGVIAVAGFYGNRSRT
ncbi:MAG: GlsB/YeaQ/YmgE family stress response membrane protein [Nocardioidaceae bacterium]